MDVLYATSLTKDGIVKLIEQFYCGKPGGFALEGIAPRLWNVVRTSDGKVMETIVRKADRFFLFLKEVK